MQPSDICDLPGVQIDVVDEIYSRGVVAYRVTLTFDVVVEVSPSIFYDTSPIAPHFEKVRNKVRLQLFNNISDWLRNARLIS